MDLSHSVVLDFLRERTGCEYFGPGFQHIALRER